MQSQAFVGGTTTKIMSEGKKKKIHKCCKNCKYGLPINEKTVRCSMHQFTMDNCQCCYFYVECTKSQSGCDCI